MKGSFKGTINRALAIAACVAVVPAAIAGLVWWAYRAPLSAFRPYINDEVTYWHQTLTFSRAGFGGGFYTSSEITNASGVTPFGAHGPGFPVLYGLVGSAVPWHLHTPVVINLTLIGLAAWLCLALSRARTSRAWLLCALFLTFWPMLLWAPTAMQESLHHAGAIALAGCMAGTLAVTPSQTARLTGWPLLALLGFIRPSWLVLMPVWALASTRGRRPMVIAIALAASVVTALAVLAAYSRTTAPFVPPFFFLRATSAVIDLPALWTNTVDNLSRSVALGEYEPQEVLLRLQYWGWLAGVLMAVAAFGLKRRDATAVHLPYLLAGAASMAAALAVMLVLYTLTNAAEHRVLSAFLLLAAVLAALAPGRAGVVAVSVLIASNLATVPLFLHAFKEERQDNFVWDRRGQRELETALAESHLAFHPGQRRWCNTLLTSQFPPFLTAVPAGIGLSVVREADQLKLPARSKYLLLDDRVLAQFARPPRVEPLARLPYGTLYRNLDAACP